MILPIYIEPRKTQFHEVRRFECVRGEGRKADLGCNNTGRVQGEQGMYSYGKEPWSLFV